MTPEAQRIAIAEACPDKVEWHDGEPFWKGLWSSIGEGNEWLAKFDPLNDLNAMREAEKVLSVEQKYKYVCILREMVTGVTMPEYGCTFATAEQRAEAFLRTIGKWEGGAA